MGITRADSFTRMMSNFTVLKEKKLREIRYLLSNFINISDHYSMLDKPITIEFSKQKPAVINNFEYKKKQLNCKKAYILYKLRQLKKKLRSIELHSEQELFLVKGI